jgi:hypothetical protein
MTIVEPLKAQAVPGAARADARPEIILRPGEMPAARSQLIEALQAKPDEMYLHNARIVRVEHIQRDSPDTGVKTQVTQVLELRAVGLPEFEIACDAVACFTRHGAQRDCPQKLAASLHRSPPDGLLPRIERISEVPLLMPDNTIINHGLHQGTYVRAPVVTLPDLWRGAALGAARRLAQLMGEFVFPTARDQAAALALLLTAAIRPVIEIAPGFVVSKPTYGAGATTLAKLAGILATGRAPAVLGVSAEATELAKALGAALISGRGVLLVDNVTEGAVFKSPLLAQALSEPTVDVRELGHSRNITCDTRRLVVITGVNVTPGRDLQRRVLRIELAPRTATPEARVFKRPNLLDEVQVDHAEILKYAFTIIGAYRKSGERTPVMPLAGFERWAATCVAPLVWLGYPDPLAEVMERVREDPTTVLLAALLTALPRDREFAARDLLNMGERVRLLLVEATEDNEPSALKVGKFLERVAGRYVQTDTDTLCIARSREQRGSARWTVQSM